MLKLENIKRMQSEAAKLDRLSQASGNNIIQDRSNQYVNLYRLITLLIFISATSAYASQSSVDLYERFDDIRVVAVISIEDINNSPMWNPGFDPLPLSVDGAIQSIKDFIKNPDMVGAIEKIELRTIKNHPGHWHYLFKLTTTNDTNSSDFEMYAVLMNGKVIPAFIEPNAIK